MTKKRRKKENRGGAREGAGRKSTGRKPYLVRLKPETHGHLKALAQHANSSIGEVIEFMVDER